ncbi:MAG: hypothetical protein ACO2PN_04070 [Pyrobaculum sp.]
MRKRKREKRELRHRIKQTPFKKLVRAVEDKAAEGGSAVVYVSSYRNSKVVQSTSPSWRTGVTGTYCAVRTATSWIETRRRC